MTTTTTRTIETTLGTKCRNCYCFFFCVFTVCWSVILFVSILFAKAKKMFDKVWEIEIIFVFLLFCVLCRVQNELSVWIKSNNKNKNKCNNNCYNNSKNNNYLRNVTAVQIFNTKRTTKEIQQQLNTNIFLTNNNKNNNNKQLTKIAAAAAGAITTTATK